jgi:hypothetical protein
MGFRMLANVTTHTDWTQRLYLFGHKAVLSSAIRSPTLISLFFYTSIGIEALCVSKPSKTMKPRTRASSVGWSSRKKIAPGMALLGRAAIAGSDRRT